MSETVNDTFDVVVVGAGPAGATAARVAASGGLSVALVDKATFPRYKTCGGGLIGPSLRKLPQGSQPPVREQIQRATFSLAAGPERLRTSDESLISTVVRSEFDQWLVDLAVEEGVEFRSSCSVKSIAQDPEGVTVQTSSGSVRARIVIGADGTSGQVGRHVGVQLHRVDLGLELEVKSAGLGSQWDSRIHLDWGPIPGSYAWVFPKQEMLTIGVIAAKGHHQDTKRYLRDFVQQMGLGAQDVVMDSGHITRTRTPSSPLARGRVLVAGDAAGLLEPWTREGISFAVRSGSAAGQTAIDCLASDPAEVSARYTDLLSKEILPEMAAGEACLQAFERHPGVFHRLISGTPIGWREFRRIARGETTLARAYRHLAVRGVIAGLTAVPPRASR